MVTLGRSIGNTKGATGTPKGTTLGIMFLIYTRIKLFLQDIWPVIVLIKDILKFLGS